MKASKKVISALLFGLALFPVQVLAHSENEAQQDAIMVSTYFLIGISILFLFFFIVYMVLRKKMLALNNVKQKEERDRRFQLSKNVKKLRWAWILSLVGVFISGVTAVLGMGAGGSTEVTIKHTHGVGYSSDGEQIFIPAHDGFVVYSNGHWEIPEGEKHDYMGFSMVDDGFYSSGHPTEGSNMVNPFGIVKSTDGGETLQTLTLKGEVDFHTMAAGYQSHTIYVINAEPNSEMDSPGLYYTKNEAKTWSRSEMNGMQGDESINDPMALVPMAVHPTNDSVVAIGTQNGLFLSTDYGDNFKKVLTDMQITSLFFNTDGTIYVGAFKGEPVLLQFSIESEKTDKINLPDLTEDAINFFAQNPINENEMVFTSFKNNVYLTNNKGASWTKIADQGKGISEENH